MATPPVKADGHSGDEDLRDEEVVRDVEEGAPDDLGPTGNQPGLSGYYEYQPTYWNNPSYDPQMVGKPELGSKSGDRVMDSQRQDVWVKGGYHMLDDNQKKLVVDASNSRGEYKVPSSWYDGTLRSALNISSASEGTVTVEQALQAMIDPDVLADIESGGGRGGGRTITAPDDTQIRRIMDQTSMGLIGRTLNDKEFNKYYKEYKKEYLGAQGNIDTQQVLTERIREEDDYQEMSVAKKFGAAMANVLKGSL
jgi:hypothetical protein